MVAAARVAAAGQWLAGAGYAPCLSLCPAVLAAALCVLATAPAAPAPHHHRLHKTLTAAAQPVSYYQCLILGMYLGSVARIFPLVRTQLSDFLRFFDETILTVLSNLVIIYCCNTGLHSIQPENPHHLCVCVHCLLHFFTVQ